MDEAVPQQSGESHVADAGERPTLKTIARIAGLAVPTVSRALSDAPDIGTDTKRRVREIAARIGYRPNRAGVRLRTGKTNVIALILSTEHEMMNHTARLISSLAGSLRGTSYHLNVTPYFPDQDPMDPVRYVVETASADGIVMNQTEPRDPRVAYLLERDFPFATHGRTVWNHPYADFDNFVFGQIAVEKLAARERRRIALISPPTSQFYAMHMREGCAEAAERLGCDLTVIAGATSDSRAQDIGEIVGRYLAGSPAIDGLVAPSTMAVLSSVAQAERMGLKPGREFDIAGKEAFPLLRLFRPEILTVFEDVMKVGQFLGQAVMQRIADPTAPPMQYLDVPPRDWDGPA